LSDPAAPAPTRGLLRATLTLLAGGAFAQALPLLLGPWLTRLYTPEAYGRYQLFATLAINLSVVACARYEFALPLARADAEVQALRRLCWRILTGVGVLALLGGVAWAWRLGDVWPLWLGPAVAVGGALSLATMLAARRQAFQALAVGRVLQYGGAALGQVGAGLMQWGVSGLVMAPVLAQLATTWLLGRAAVAAPPPAGDETALRLRDVARRWREFPLLNTPHAFAGALQDTLAVGLIAATLGPAAAGFWGLTLRYLKAPATLVGTAVSQALYPKLAEAGPGVTLAGRAAVRRVMAVLMLAAAPLVLALWSLGPWLFGWLFGAAWAESGQLARALALYIGAHFVASPLAVVTMAWGAQAWALRLAIWGQLAFVLALLGGLQIGGLAGAGWAVSLLMAAYFGWYFWRLANWPLAAQQASSAAAQGETS
jgi:O-antigen/teichoic acid export membrane protein